MCKKAYISFVTKNPAPLECVSYFSHLMRFKKIEDKIWVLLDFDDEINAMMPAYTVKFDFMIRSINVRAQKIDGSIFKTFKIVLASF